MHHCSSDKVIVHGSGIMRGIRTGKKNGCESTLICKLLHRLPSSYCSFIYRLLRFFFVVRFMCMCNSTRYTCERLAAAAAAKTLNYINVVFLWLQWGLDLLLLPSIIAVQSFVISCVCVWDQLHNLLDKKIGKKNRFIPSIHHKMHLIIMRNLCKVQDALVVSIRQ